MLNKPYPLEERKPAQLKLATIFGLAVFLFILLLSRFGEVVGKENIVLNAAVAGILTTITIAADFYIFFLLFPNFFRDEKWTIGLELIWTLIIIVTIATINMLAGSLLWGVRLTLANWWEMILYTVIIGIAPATISIIVNQQRLLKKYRKEVVEINEVIAEPVKNQVLLHEKELTISSENIKDSITMPAGSFLVASSADNYIKVFYKKNDAVVTAMLRSTLKRVEEDAAAFPQLFRCHRTALVNLQAVNKLTGSAQGYRLQVHLLTEEIPVSRSLNAIIKEKLAAIHP